MLVERLLAANVTILFFLYANALTCQRCTHVIWKGLAGKEGPDERLAGLVLSHWPRSCVIGQGAGFDSELCAADGRHVCVYVMAEFSLIYAANVTVAGKTKVYNSSAVGVAHIRGCIEESLGCFKSLSDKNRHYVADEVSQLIDQSAVSSLEVISKRGTSCTCATNHCVAGSHLNAPDFKAIQATTSPATTAAMRLMKQVAGPVDSVAFPDDSSSHVQQITNIYWIVELPLDVIVCVFIAVVVCVKVTRCRQRNRKYINVVRLSVKRQWF